MIKYLLIPIEETEQTFESINILPLEIQKELATYNISSIDLAKYFQIHFNQIQVGGSETNYANEVVAAISSGEYFIIPYEIKNFETNLNNKEQISLILNNNLLVEIHRNKEEYIVNLYNQHMPNTDGLLGSAIITDKQISNTILHCTN